MTILLHSLIQKIINELTLQKWDMHRHKLNRFLFCFVFFQYNWTIHSNIAWYLHSIPVLFVLYSVHLDNKGCEYLTFVSHPIWSLLLKEMYNEHRKLIRLKDSLQEKEMEMVNNKFRVAANPTVSSSSVQFF